MVAVPLQAQAPAAAVVSRLIVDLCQGIVPVMRQMHLRPDVERPHRRRQGFAVWRKPVILGGPAVELHPLDEPGS